jgi:hypothetical protein
LSFENVDRALLDVAELGLPTPSIPTGERLSLESQLVVAARSSGSGRAKEDKQILVGLLFRLTWSGVGFCEISVIDSKSHPTWNTESVWSCALKQSTNLDVNESSAGVLSSLPQAARSSLVLPGPFDLLAAPA